MFEDRLTILVPESGALADGVRIYLVCKWSSGAVADILPCSILARTDISVYPSAACGFPSVSIAIIHYLLSSAIFVSSPNS